MQDKNVELGQGEVIPSVDELQNRADSSDQEISVKFNDMNRNDDINDDVLERAAEIRNELQQSEATGETKKPIRRTTEVVRPSLFKSPNTILEPISRVIETVRTNLDFIKLRPYQSPVEETRLSIQELDFNLTDYYQKLNELGQSDLLQTTQIGEIEYQGEKYPMYNMQRLVDPSLPTISVVTAIHGNEQAPLLASLVFLQELTHGNPAYAGVNVSVITPANPVGADYNSRYNGQGYDINRDFVRFYTPEARVIRDVLTSLKPDVVITTHEVASPETFMGGLMLSSGIRDSVLDELRKANVPLGRKGFLGIPLKQPGYLHFGRTFGLANSLGSHFDTATLEWYLSRHKIPSLTIETSCLVSDQELRVNGQLAVIRGVASALATNKSIK